MFLNPWKRSTGSRVQGDGWKSTPPILQLPIPIGIRSEVALQLLHLWLFSGGFYLPHLYGSEVPDDPKRIHFQQKMGTRKNFVHPFLPAIWEILRPALSSLPLVLWAWGSEGRKWGGKKSLRRALIRLSAGQFCTLWTRYMNFLVIGLKSPKKVFSNIWTHPMNGYMNLVFIGLSKILFFRNSPNPFKIKNLHRSLYSRFARLASWPPPAPASRLVVTAGGQEDAHDAHFYVWKFSYTWRFIFLESWGRKLRKKSKENWTELWYNTHQHSEILGPEIEYPRFLLPL